VDMMVLGAAVHTRKHSAEHLLHSCPEGSPHLGAESKLLPAHTAQQHGAPHDARGRGIAVGFVDRHLHDSISRPRSLGHGAASQAAAP